MFRTYLIAILIVLATVYGIYRVAVRGGANSVPEESVAQLADCLTESGAKLYGTFWCPHCTDQKEAFGSSFGRVHYIECTVDGQRNVMSEECKEAGVSGFPTWIFGDGSRLGGKQGFAELASRSGCEWQPANTSIESPS
jgi:glutaredoxin